MDLVRHALSTSASRRPACALELLDGGGWARSYAVWRLSETGAVLAIIEAGEA